MSRSLSIVALFLIGCGSPPATIHDAIADAAAIACQAEFRCCTMQQAMQKSGVANSSQCGMSVTGADNQFSAAIQTGIDKGLYRYDPTSAQICLDAIKGAVSDCTAPYYQADFQSNPFCASVIQGTIQPGGNCDIANYLGGCVPGSYCTASHACKLFAQSGQDCTTTLCAPGLACLPTGMCGQPIADGGNCQVNPQCKSGDCTGGVCKAPQTVQQALCM